MSNFFPCNNVGDSTFGNVPSDSIYTSSNVTSARFSCVRAQQQTNQNLTIEGDLVFGPDAQLINFPASSALPPSLQSIANLVYQGDQMLFTNGTPEEYAYTPANGTARNLLAQVDVPSQQAALALVPGVQVQTYSAVLDNIASLNVPANSTLYTTAPNTYSATPLSAVGRSLIGQPSPVSADQMLYTSAIDTISTTPLTAVSRTLLGTNSIVDLNSAQTLTNKTLTDSSNTVRATQLGTTTNDVVVSGSAVPSVGQVLTATSTTTAEWQPASGGITNSTGSSIDNHVVRFDGTTGDVVQDGTNVTIDDSSNISGVLTLTATNLSGTLTTSAQPNVSSVGTLTSLTTSGNIDVGGSNVVNVNLVDGVDVSALSPLTPIATDLGGLTSAEITQLQNIDASTITTSQWAFVGSMDQNVATTDTPTFTGLSANNTIISDVATPVAGTDAASKSYVDSTISSGLVALTAAQYASDTVLPNAPTYASPAETLTSSAGAGTALVIDGHTTVVGDNGIRVVVKNQADARENGVYVLTDYGGGASPWLLTRASDFNQAATPIVKDTFVFIEASTGAVANPNTSWLLQTTVNTLDPLTDSVDFVQFSGSQTLTAGTGLTQTGNTLNVNGTAGRISVTATTVDIDATYVGQSSITTLGTVTSGTWNGTDIAVADGGTGASTATDARTNLGLVIGTDVQAHDVALDNLSTIATGANQVVTTTGVDTFGNLPFGVSGANLLSQGVVAADEFLYTTGASTFGSSGIAAHARGALAEPAGNEVVTETEVQTLENKTLIDNTTNIQNNVDPTKNIRFDVGAVTTGTTRVYATPDQNDTLVGLTATQTLTNKTLTAVSNTIRATQLGTTTTDVVVDTAAAPSAGQVLTAVSGVAAQWQAPVSLPPALARTVSVTQNVAGFVGDYTTIGAALADIGVGAVRSDLATPASAVNPIVIQVNPGLYVETNPLVVPQYVTITSLVSSKGVVVYPSVSGVAFFQVNPNASLRGLTISNFNFQTFTKVVATITRGVEFVGAAPGTGTIPCSDCLVYDCQECWYAAGTGVANSIIPRIINSGAVSLVETNVIGFHATNGASFVGVIVTASGFFGLGGNMETGFLCDGNNTLFQLVDANVNFSTNGYVVENGTAGNFADMQIYGGITSNIGDPNPPNDGDVVRVGNFSSLEIFNVNIREQGNQSNILYFNGLSQPPPNNSTARVSGVVLEQRSIFIATDFDISGTILGSTEDERQTLIVGELSVGLPNRGSESIFGEGDSHVFGMTVLTFDAFATTFTDVTSQVSRIDGTSVAIFPSNTSGDILYVGMNPALGVFYGLKATISVGATPTSGITNASEPPTYAWEWEYWDGTAWTPFRIMSTLANQPYTPQRRNAFDAGEYQYRFDSIQDVNNFFENSDGTSGVFISSSAVINGVNGPNQWVTSTTPPGNWQTTTVNGTLLLWMRVRLITPLTVVPEIDQLKLHTNRTEINSNGYLERYGTARTWKRVPGNFQTWRDDDAVSPGNQNLYFGDSIGLDMNDNNFVPTATDRICRILALPTDLDSSHPMILQWRWIPSNGNSGNVQWNVRWAYSVDGAFAPGDPAAIVNVSTGTAPTNAPTQQQIAFTTSAPGVLRQQVTTYCQLDISNMITTRTKYGNGDLMWVSFERTGGAAPDTFTGSVFLVDINLLYCSATSGIQ